MEKNNVNTMFVDIYNGSNVTMLLRGLTLPYKSMVREQS